MKARRILVVTSEVAPLAATGELAFTVFAYVRALRRRGHDVRLVLPHYSCVSGGDYRRDFSVRLGGRPLSCILKETAIDTVGGPGPIPAYLIGNHEYFDRAGLYGEHGVGYKDNGDRFGFFAMAALRMMKELDFQAELVHLFDWQSAMAALFLRNHLADDPFYQPMRCIFTIHNLQYQGNFDTSLLSRLDLGWEYFVPSKLEFFWKVSFLKAGLLYADQLTTVSETYAAEIRTRRYGEGLEGLINQRAACLTGISNGLDVVEWDPARDSHIATVYDADHLEGKAACRQALLAECGLTPSERPLVVSVNRLVQHKGMDFILEVLPPLLEADRLRLVVLGVGDAHYHQAFSALAERFPGRMAFRPVFDPTLSRRVYAGADIAIFPALFEPSGIGHRISVRYGAVPVVRLTGGLQDGFRACGESCPAHLPRFSFLEPRATEFAGALTAALEAYAGDATIWQELVRCLMRHDFSWNQACLGYERLMETMLMPALEGKN